ncbi:MAG: asparagine synthase (glutamine-hydrolyzing) [Candidatus Omnitrophica bacterium]|nr:asparagine synthase (glutamine-hydrolyzing) [Candidatus Omnitrophota bacterium]
MCGICGVIKKEGSFVEKECLKEMTDALVHRGPDEDGHFLFKNAGMGMRRLSIIDVKGGHQPIYNERKNVCVICNGEIYNYIELKERLMKSGHIFKTSSDVEVIVHLYEDKGEDFVDDLRGMFAIAIYDLDKKRLILARDRLGIKPLYYYSKNGVFLFGSEIKAIKQYPGVQTGISLTAVSDYLTYLYIPGPDTIFEDIYKLPPACLLIFEKDKINIKKYWEISYKKREKQYESYYIENLSSLLKETIKMHLMSEVPLGAFLSGGMDSSAIVALMSEVSGQAIKTFSVGFNTRGFDELKYARLVAKKFGTEHHEINLEPDIIKLLPDLVGHFDEPFADSSLIPTYLISGFARKEVTVCLSGDGGDELFAGYDWTRRQKFINDYRRIPRVVRQAMKHVLLSRDYQPDRRNRILNKIERFVYDSELSLEDSFLRRRTCFSEALKTRLFQEEIVGPLGNYQSASKLSGLFSGVSIDNDIERLLFVDTKSYLPDDCLCKVDMMSMKNSLEVRVPFLDHKVVEFVSSIPLEFKLKGRISKYILKKALKEELPAQVLRQRKLGFTMPLNNWFRFQLKNNAKEMLLANDCQSRRFFSVSFVEWMLKDHFDNKQDFGAQIFALLVFELWLRKQKI